MNTLGSKSCGWSSLGRRIGRSIERCRVRVGGGVGTCGFVFTGSVSLDHQWMAWWSACIAASLLSHAMVRALCKLHVSVVTPWKMQSIGVTSGCVRLWCLNSTVSETRAARVVFAKMVCHR